MAYRPNTPKRVTIFGVVYFLVHTQQSVACDRPSTA